MAVYAIGDVQGCYRSLEALLEKIGFEPAHDLLWFTGDLVNRGPQSAEVLRFIKSLGDRAVTVLGNHDLHLLAVATGQTEPDAHDTFKDVLCAPDRHELLTWLRTRPLLHHDKNLGYTLVHAGLLPSWDLADAQRLAHEVEFVLGSNDAEEFFHQLYGDFPKRWHPNLRGFERLRVIVNALTRMRYCGTEGDMDLKSKGPPGSQATGLVPWFKAPNRRSSKLRVVFGHWSTLGVWQGDGVICLDSGCLWGHTLTAARLDREPVEFFNVPCETQQASRSGAKIDQTDAQ